MSWWFNVSGDRFRPISASRFALEKFSWESEAHVWWHLGVSQHGALTCFSWEDQKQLLPVLGLQIQILLTPGGVCVFVRVPF